MELIKVVIPVLDETLDKRSWVHICYVSEDVYLNFLDSVRCERFEVADFISKWAEHDFNIKLSMTTCKDIGILKELIRDRYRIAHPHIFLDTPTDRQGWVRTWVTEKMERELKQHESSVKK